MHDLGNKGRSGCNSFVQHAPQAYGDSVTLSLEITRTPRLWFGGPRSGEQTEASGPAAGGTISTPSTVMQAKTSAPMRPRPTEP